MMLYAITLIISLQCSLVLLPTPTELSDSNVLILLTFTCLNMTFLGPIYVLDVSDITIRTMYLKPIKFRNRNQ